MKTPKIILITLLSLLLSQILYSQVPNESLDLGSLAKELGKSLTNKKIEGISEADVKRAMNYKSETAKRLAAVFPEGEERNNMEKFYNLSLFAHQQSEALLGIEKGDIYGAIAAYLYGNWSSCNNGQTIPDESLVNMVNQVRSLLQPVMDQKFNTANEIEKKLAYEEFAMIGNWMLIMQTYLRQNPNAEAAESLRGLAFEYLQKLQIRPEQLDFTQEGDVILSQ